MLIEDEQPPEFFSVSVISNIPAELKVGTGLISFEMAPFPKSHSQLVIVVPAGVELRSVKLVVKGAHPVALLTEKFGLGLP